MANRSTRDSPGFNGGNVCTYADSVYVPISLPSKTTPVNSRDWSHSMVSGGPTIAESQANIVKLKIPKSRKWRRRNGIKMRKNKEKGEKGNNNKINIKKNNKNYI